MRKSARGPGVRDGPSERACEAGMVAASHGSDPTDVVRSYLQQHFRIVTWPAIGDTKGPHDPGWPNKVYTLDDYHEGYRVGILTGTEVAPGRWLHDVDIDWNAGAKIALSLLPGTGFVFGRPGKQYSHCFYTLPEPLPSFKYEDIDKTTLIELRGTKLNGDVGLQTMVPPSVWSKDGQREKLQFVVREQPEHIPDAERLRRRVMLTAIAMLLAKHLGKHGFGHDPRLAWAGFLLRAGVAPEDLVLMGKAMSEYCHNTEVADVQRVVDTTEAGLRTDAKKVKGGPALAKILGANGKDIIARINEWMGRDADFIRDSKGMIVPKNQSNIKRAIEKLGHELSYNEFADKLLVDGKPMEDRITNEILTRIEIEYRFQPPEAYFERIIKYLAWQHPFHPVKDYLDGLQWDGEPRIDTWLIEAGGVEDSPYTRAVSSIMLIAAVRRIRMPGCKYDEMVVWESPRQGTEKSSAAQALCPRADWFSDDLRLNLHSQQLIESTLGKWIIEASDLAGKRKTEIEQLKAMLSRQVDGPARLAYAHFAVERPRHFIIIGTTNSSVYLTDPTGSRRFWPLEIKQRFDVRWITMHRDQLWAEACVREAKGESIRLREDLWPVAAEQQEARREIDPWESVISTRVFEVEPSGDGKRRVTASLIWDGLGIPLERRDRSASLRITDIMQRLGFKRTRVRPPGEDVQVGFVEEIKEREPGEDE